MALLDIRLKAARDLARRCRGFLYVLEGRGRIGGTEVGKGDVAWFEPGEAEVLRSRLRSRCGPCCSAASPSASRP
jgi:hypothetical protein